MPDLYWYSKGKLCSDHARIGKRSLFCTVFPDRITTRDIVKRLLPLLLRQFLTSVSVKHVIRLCSPSESVFSKETNERVALP